MTIELRFDDAGPGRIAVTCFRCGAEIDDPRDGIAIWVAREEPHPIKGEAYHLEHAHRGCEELHPQYGPAAGCGDRKREASIPLTELLHALGVPQALERVGRLRAGNDEPVDDDPEVDHLNIDYYSDHRRGDLDSYPTIAVCDGCAQNLGGELGGRTSPETGRALTCEECGVSNRKGDEYS